MEKIYYVAMCSSCEILSPAIAEKFTDSADANAYAALMSRTKKKKYVVLEQITEWDGTALEVDNK